jgi:hypothetical protein
VWFGGFLIDYKTKYVRVDLGFGKCPLIFQRIMGIYAEKLDFMLNGPGRAPTFLVQIKIQLRRIILEDAKINFLLYCVWFILNVIEY